MPAVALVARRWLWARFETSSEYVPATAVLLAVAVAIVLSLTLADSELYLSLAVCPVVGIRLAAAVCNEDKALFSVPRPEMRA